MSTGRSIIPSTVHPSNRDVFLNLLNENGFYVLGYADNLAIGMIEEFARTVTELLQEALKILEVWYKKVDLTINPEKTVIIPFMMRKKLDELSSISEVSLGLTLDSKLNWNAHLQKTSNKRKMTLMATKRTISKN